MRAQNDPSRMAVPPPRELELTDLDRPVGWVRGDTIGFRGFGSAVEAAHAAIVAYRAMMRRLARRAGAPPDLLDDARAAIDVRLEPPAVLLDGRAIATLPPRDDAADDAAFAFEIAVPPPHDEVSVRAAAYLMYRSLRRSGVRWRMWDAAELAAPVFERTARRRRRRAGVARRGAAMVRELLRRSRRAPRRLAAALAVAAASLALLVLAVALPARYETTFGVAGVIGVLAARLLAWRAGGPAIPRGIPAASLRLHASSSAAAAATAAASAATPPPVPAVRPRVHVLRSAPSVLAGNGRAS